MQVNTNNISLTTLKQQLSKYSKLFGYEEKLEGGALDTTNDWTLVTGDTGAQALSDFSISLDTGATSGSIVSISSKQLFPITGNLLVQSTGRFNKFVMEFSAYILNVSNIDNTTFLMGLANSNNSTRASQYIAGFIFDGDALKAIVDRAGTETLSDAITYTPGAWNNFRIEVQYKTANFYLNGVLVSTITMASVISCSKLNFYLKNDAAAQALMYVAGISAWTEDNP